MRRIAINVHPLRDFLVLLFAAVLTMILLALVAPKPAEATFPGSNGSIVFESTLTGGTELYSMAPNGTGLTRLTNNTWPDRAPVFSPAGTQIAYTDEREPDDEIFAMSAYWTPTKLTDNQVDDYHPTWSPTGKEIAFGSTRDVPFHGDIYTMNVDTKQTKRLSANDPQNPDDSVYDPNWSPRGGLIAFTRFDNAEQHIWTMNASDGSGQRQLTEGANLGPSFHDASEPNWSPDGTRIAFSAWVVEESNTGADKDLGQDIWVMNADGSGKQNLFPNDPFQEEEFGPAWSPDGTKIAFVSDRDGDEEIYVMNAAPQSATNQPQKLTSNSSRDYDPDWGPGYGVIDLPQCAEPFPCATPPYPPNLPLG